MGTLLVGSLVLIAIVCSIRKIVKDKKQGNCCGGSCNSCGSHCKH